MKSMSKKTSVGFAFGVLLILLANGAAAVALPEDGAPSQETGQEYGPSSRGSFLVPSYGTYTQPLLSNLQSNRLYNVAVGLQITGPDSKQRVEWAVQCDSTEAVAQAVFDWVGYHIIWQSLTFVTRSSFTSGCELIVWNMDSNSQTFYYYMQYSTFETMTKSSEVTDYSSSFSVLPGQRKVITISSNLAGNTLYFYEVGMNYQGSPTEQVRTNVAFNCYKASGDPDPPHITLESRHVRYWVIGGTWSIMMKLIVPTKASGAYCQLKVTHQESSTKDFTAKITHYTSSKVINRQTEVSWTRWRETIPGNGQLTLVIDTYLQGGYDYVAIANICVITGDTTQSINSYVGIGYRQYDLGLKDGHSVKYWSSYRRSLSTTLGGSPYYSNDAWIQVYNSDSQDQDLEIYYHIYRWSYYEY